MMNGYYFPAVCTDGFLEFDVRQSCSKDAVDSSRRLAKSLATNVETGLYREALQKLIRGVPGIAMVQLQQRYFLGRR